MRKWGALIVATVFLFCVAGLVYAQASAGTTHGGLVVQVGDRGPGLEGGPEFGLGPREGARAYSETRPTQEGRPQVSVQVESGDENEEDAESSDEAECGPDKAERSESDSPKHHGLFGHERGEFRRGARAVALGLVLLVVIPVLIVLFWVLPISMGVCIARRRKLSPLWMLFGIPPMAGWIACLVLALSKGKIECGKCGGYVKPNFRQCPFCEQAIASPTPPKA
jgi:hypothetical protein